MGLQFAREGKLWDFGSQQQRNIAMVVAKSQDDIVDIRIIMNFSRKNLFLLLFSKRQSNCRTAPCILE